MSRSMELLAGIVLVWLALCGKASALTELCPASVADFGAAGGSVPTAPATAFGYDLTALTPRTIGATLLADTDRGWFGWRVTSVPLTAARLPNGGYQGRGARSAPLEIDFPAPVVVAHAWISTASAPGEAIFGWGSAGDAACDVPAYAAREDPAPSRAPSTRAAASAIATAEPVPPPFALTCAQPFVAPRVLRAAKPTLPKDAFAPGDNPATALVDVALDERGAPYDAWVSQRAGQVLGFDQSALSAARLSEYAGAISYCQAVKSIYTFRLDFQSL
jgi:hypothetical protein